MDSFLNEMLGSEGNNEARERFRSLWDVSASIRTQSTELTPYEQEYEARQTPESKLVKVSF